jgi:tRNA(fMet)-specific endonuclease VapC
LTANAARSYQYMLDTNIVSAMVRKPHGALAGKLSGIDTASICISIVVAAEIRFGLAKGVAKQMQLQIDAILEAIDILPLSAPVDTHYGEIRSYLEKRGQPISANGLFIAAHARSLNLILVSNNTREFERVPGLQLENWLATT